MMTGWLIAAAIVALAAGVSLRDLLPSRRRLVLGILMLRPEGRYQPQIGMSYVGLGAMVDDGLIVGEWQPDGRRLYRITPAGVEYWKRAQQ